jgi:hypothetical protein
LHQTLDKEVYQLSFKVVPKASARENTYQLTKSLSDMTIRKIFHMFAQSMTINSSKVLTKILTASLTNSLSVVITRALTRAPVGDIFCQLCREQTQEAPKLEEFCDACWSSETAGYYADYYTLYYANYYSHYYTHYYGSYWAKDWAGSYIMAKAIPKDADPREDANVQPRAVE